MIRKSFAYLTNYLSITLMHTPDWNFRFTPALIAL